MTNQPMTLTFNRHSAMRTKFGLAALFAAVLGFVGCSNVDEQGGTNNDTPAPAEYQLTINATAHEPATRVVISGDKTNGFETSWEVGDQIGVFTYTEAASQRSECSCNFPLENTIVNSDGTTVFSGTLPSGLYAGVHDLYVYYPYKSSLADKNHYENSTTTFEDVKCQIPAEQAMTESGSYDPTAAYMVARPSTIDLSESKAVETTMTFRHLNCFVNLSTKSVTADGVSGDEVVNSIAMTVAGKTLAGDFELNLADGSTNFTSTSETITVAVPDGTTLADLSAWLVVNPFSLASGDELELVITTDKNIITKTITGKTINFAIKNVITLNLAIDNTCTVEPFTASNLFADGTYVIADDTNKKLMIPGPESDDFRGYANYTTIPATVSAEQAWILTSVGNPGENLYTIQSAESNKYLSYNNSSTGTKNNYAQLNDEYDSDKSDMLITATEDGKGYQIKWNTNQQRILGYNSNSPRFAFYLGTQQNVLTLVPVEVATTISVTSANEITTNPAATDGTISYSLIYGEDGAKVSATSSASWLTVGEITSTSVAYSIAANTDAARTATITLSYEGAEDVTISVTQKAQSLTITSATDVNVAAEANSTLSVAYTLVAADDDAAITAESSATWLTIGNITSTSVAYSVSENTSTEERTATITLAYGTLTQEVTVNQSGVGSATEYTVVYTPSSKTAISVTSGTAPDGSSVTYNNTYATNQITGGKSATLTLSGYDGAKITGVTLHMRSSNRGNGAGLLDMTVGTTNIAHIADSTFKDWTNNDSIGTAETDVTLAVDPTVVGTDQDVKIIINASVSSLYIFSYTITYEM